MDAGSHGMRGSILPLRCKPCTLRSGFLDQYCPLATVRPTSERASKLFAWVPPGRGGAPLYHHWQGGKTGKRWLNRRRSRCLLVWTGGAGER